MAAMPISASFSICATRALSNLSATWPPKAENRKNGAMNTAPASVTRAGPLLFARANTMRNTSTFLTKLSLSAARNWQPNKGPKRREVISEGICVASLMAAVSMR